MTVFREFMAYIKGGRSRYLPRNRANHILVCWCDVASRQAELGYPVTDNIIIQIMIIQSY